jgi:hypothetical protein
MSIGRAAMAIVLQSRDGKLYFGTQTVTVQANQTMEPQLEELSETEIVRRIRLL